MNNEINAKQTAKLDMYRATEKHINDNAAIVASNAAFQTALNKFKSNIAAITETAQQKSGALTGITTDKNNLKQTLCTLAANIAGVVFAYASANSNNTLKAEMNLPVTTLMRTRDNALAPRCQNIHDKAVANRVALEDFGITASMLSDLQTAINSYSSETMKPRAAISGRKTINTNLNALFKENDRILNDQLDKLIELFRPENPDFVQTYESTRIIVDPPTQARKPKDSVNKDSN